jgi:Putative Actinobacterial Holin-X, holin superfamily III
VTTQSSNADDIMASPPAAPIDMPAVGANSVDADAIDSGSAMSAVRALIDEASATLASEMALAKTVGTIAGVSLQRMAMWGIMALLFAFVGLLALSVGLVIALAGITGPLVAALIVGGGLMGIGLVAGLMARGYAQTLRNAARLIVE